MKDEKIKVKIDGNPAEERTEEVFGKAEEKTSSECDAKSDIKSEAKSDAKSEAKSANEGSDGDSDEAAELNALNKEKDEKIKALTEEVAAVRDGFLRYQADTENYKKRLIREKEEAILFANSRLIKDLFEFFDNLDRVIDAAKKGGDAQSICTGVELMRSQLMGTLNKNWGLEKIETVDTEFDPSEHEACMMEVSSDVKTEMVTAELQAGYKLHGRVIRPAKVKVAKPE